MCVYSLLRFHRSIYSGRDSSELRRSWTARVRARAEWESERMPRERILNFLNWSAANPRRSDRAAARLYSLSWRVTSLPRFFPLGAPRIEIIRATSTLSRENAGKISSRELSEIRSSRGLEFPGVKSIARKNRHGNLESKNRGFRKRMIRELERPLTECKFLILYLIKA